MTADPFDAVWPEARQDIVTALAAVPQDRAAAAPPAGRQAGRHELTRPRFTPRAVPVRQWSPPYPASVLEQVANGLRHLDDTPAPSALPLYAATAAARNGTAAQPAAGPETAPEPQPAPATAVPPRDEAPADDGHVRRFLADALAAYAGCCTAVAEVCPDCRRVNGWCARHEAKRATAAAAEELGTLMMTAASTRDALLALAVADLSGQTPASQVPASGDPAWPGQRDRSVFLLTEAESAALPDTYGCCADDKPCGSHAQAQEAAGLVGAIRDAAIDAGSAAEAAALIAVVITEGGK